METWAPTRSSFATPGRYALVGAAAFALDFFVFGLLALGLGAPAWQAQLASRTLGAVAGFVGHRAFTFRSAGPIAAQGLGYALVAAWNLLWSPWLVDALIAASGGRILLAKLVAEALIVAQTYALLRVVFRAPEVPR